MTSPILLQIETSSSVCSVALSSGKSLLSLKEIAGDANHAALLAVMIEEVLVETKYDSKALDAIVLSSGPGSYTGLRIGAATAKGMCYALNKPLIAVDSLSVLAYAMSITADGQKRIFCPTIDARRDEIYYGLFDQNGEVIRPSVNTILTSDFLKDMPDDIKILIGGSAVAKCRQYVSGRWFEFDDLTKPSARWLVPLGELMFARSEFTDPVRYEPNYIKPAFVTSAKNVL